MKRSNHKQLVLLYIIIAALVLSLAALGALTFFSMKRLSSLSRKVNELTQTVSDISDSSAALTQQSEELDSLLAQYGLDSNTTETPDQTEEDGMLSPSHGDAFTDTTDSAMENLLSQIDGLLPQGNGTSAVYVCSLSDGLEGSLHDAPMQAASLIKLYIMGAVYENYDSLSQQYSAENLDANLLAMITVSDNDAANALVECLGSGDSAAGMNVVNQFCQSHGFTSTSMGRLLLQSSENGDNYTSVGDCGRFLKTVYQLANGKNADISLAHADAMYSLLKQQQRTNKIPAQMPEGVHVANKTGELDDVENDAAIVYDTAKGKDLVICFMSENVSDTAAMQNSIAQNSRLIYGYFNE